MGKVLTIKNAEIKTVGVEIKTLTIEGKQVTLTVFRQLQERSLINELTGDLNGIPWGFVNYCPSKDCQSTYVYEGYNDHLHIVWQQGIEIFRDTIYINRNEYRDIDSAKINVKVRKHIESLKQLPQLFIAV